MKNETLDLIKKDAAYKKNETEMFNATVNRIIELESNPAVQEYSRLLKSIVGIPRIINLSEKDIYELAFRQHAGEIKSDDSNGIYVCMGVFAHDKVTNFYYRTNNSDCGPLYKKYQDIELGNVVLVDLDKTEEFEKDNYVINIDCADEVNLFRDVQWDFIRESINNDQDSAIRLIHKKYSKED